MNFMRNHWYDVCLAMALVAGAAAIALWGEMGTVRKLMLLNFIALLLHQFEEYRWPGGGQAIANTMRPGEVIPDRYPLNQTNAMVGNLFFVLVFYLLAVFLPDVMWLDVAPIIFGLGQCVSHGLIINIWLKRPYNPGMAAAVLGHLPIGIYFIWYVIANNLTTGWDWVWAIIYLVMGFGIAYVLLVYKTANKETNYPFTPSEMNRFHMYEKAMVALGRESKPFDSKDMEKWPEE